MYPALTLMNPPAPTYPGYLLLLEKARSAAPRFVNPANLYPAKEVAERRGDDWCIAILGYPTSAYDYTRWSHTEHYLLLAADEADINPPMPVWVIEGRAAAARRTAEMERLRDEQQAREAKQWGEALAQAETTEFEVWSGSRSRARGSLSEALRHAVPTIDMYSGTRKVRVHAVGRAVCETPGRRPLALSGATTGPATCDRCLDWVAKVRPSRSPVQDLSTRQGQPYQEWGVRIVYPDTHPGYPGRAILEGRLDDDLAAELAAAEHLSNGAATATVVHRTWTPGPWITSPDAGDPSVNTDA